MQMNKIADINFLHRLHEDATSALASEDFDTALQISSRIGAFLREVEFVPLRQIGVRACPLCIVVVAHRATPAHADLLRTLLTLPDREVEITLVENSDRPVFPMDGLDKARNLRMFRLGGNLGIGIARDVAIHATTARHVVFIDDDGLCSAEAIRRLVAVARDHDAVAVRGRVAPITPGTAAPPHYAPGETLMQRYCDIEGFSVWRRDALIRCGGFDPILYGHEGAELSARLYPLYGPDAFLYTPDAVLFHDFEKPGTGNPDKAKRYAILTRYCEAKIDGYREILQSFRSMERDVHGRCRLVQRRRAALSAPGRITGGPSVSILTTCRDGAAFLPDYADALARQTDRAFKLVFVDDGSTDGSAELVKRLRPRRSGLSLIDGPAAGRAAALNTALDAVETDVAIILDVDDIPMPDRVARVRRLFRERPQDDLLGTLVFDRKSPQRASCPFPTGPVPLSVRSFLGMPAPFPGFAFRKRAVTQRFDETLDGGIDCDWMFRLITEDGLDGMLHPELSTYYRLHDGQITARRRDLQRRVALCRIRDRHESLMGQGAVPPSTLEQLTGWSAIATGPDYWTVFDYAMRLVQAAGASALPHADVLTAEVLRHLDTLHLRLLRQDHGALKSRHAAQGRALETAQEKAAACAATLARARKQVESARAEAAQAQDAAAAARADEAAIRNATFWRMTAPLRAAVDWTRRGAQG